LKSCGAWACRTPFRLLRTESAEINEKSHLAAACKVAFSEGKRTPNELFHEGICNWTEVELRIITGVCKKNYAM
jgi:hypothetical protein